MSILSAEKSFFENSLSPYQFLLNTCNFLPPNESLCNANIEQRKGTVNLWTVHAVVMCRSAEYSA